MLTDGNNRNEVIEHLRMIQGIIGRLNSNSFAVKRFALIVFAGSLAILTSDIELDVPTFCLPLLVLALWFLDAFYLSRERAFRGLYNSVRLQRETEFSMEIEKSFRSFVCSAFSMSVFPIYFTAALILFAVIYIT